MHKHRETSTVFYRGLGGRTCAEVLFEASAGERGGASRPVLRVRLERALRLFSAGAVASGPGAQLHPACSARAQLLQVYVATVGPGSAAYEEGCAGQLVFA